MCAHLKVVNIECVMVDEGVCKILKILRSGGILRERISIKDTCFDSVSKLSFDSSCFVCFCNLPTCSIMSSVIANKLKCMTPFKNLCILSIHYHFVIIGLRAGGIHGVY